MGKERSKRRSLKIKQAQKREKKLAKLRLLYIKSEKEEERKKIFQKVLKIAPWLTEKEFLRKG